MNEATELRHNISGHHTSPQDQCFCAYCEDIRRDAEKYRELQGEVAAFEKDTTYRLAVEAARHWLLSRVLATGELPKGTTLWVYPAGPEACLDWGNPPGMDKTPKEAPLRGKRIAVTFRIEESGV